MSLSPLPVGVSNRIKKLQQDFLCGGIGDDFKFHLVSRTKICSLVSKRVLVVYNLLLFNRTCLGRVVVDHKYGISWGGWRSKEVHKSYGVELWKSIRRGWGSFLVTLDLQLLMVPKLDYVMTCGARI